MRPSVRPNPPRSEAARVSLLVSQLKKPDVRGSAHAQPSRGSTLFLSFL
jgi:hypothetical protein